MNVRNLDLWSGLGAAVCGLVFAFGTLAVGCEKTAKEKLAEARVLLANDKPEESIELLEEVLEEQPDNFDAKRRTAEAYAQRGEFKRAEEKLDELWEERGFDGEDLSKREINYKELMNSQYVEFYKNWAEEIDAESEPEKYVEVLEKGLEYDDRDLDLNMMLARHYWKKGQKLEDKDEKKKAAEAYEKIRELRTRRGWDKRSEAREKARSLRVEFFEAEGRKRFDENGRDVVSELEGLEYDEEEDVIVIDSDEEVPRALNPNNDEHAQKAQQIAFIGLINKLRQVTLAIAGLPLETDLTTIGKERAKTILLKDLEIDDDSMEFKRRTTYTIRARLPVEQAIGMAWDVKSAYEEAQKEKEEAEKEAEEGEGEGASEGESEGEESESGENEGEEGGGEEGESE